MVGICGLCICRILDQLLKQSLNSHYTFIISHLSAPLFLQRSHALLWVVERLADTFSVTLLTAETLAGVRYRWRAFEHAFHLPPLALQQLLVPCLGFGIVSILR